MSGMDDLEEACQPIEHFTADDGHAVARVRPAAEVLAAIQSYLREHDLLLGPDGLVKLEQHGGWHRYERHGVVVCSHSMSSDGCPYLVRGEVTEGSVLPLYTLIPKEGT